MLKVRQIQIDGDIARVPLSRGLTAVIDASDAALVAPFNWYASVRRRGDGSIRTAYAVRTERNGSKTIQMHREIVRPADGLYPDHVNGDGLDNRRANLRLATSGQNSLNRRNRYDCTSGAKGVCRHKATGKWRAQIMSDGKYYHLGLFDSVEEASAAYVNASKSLHGEFGRVN
jgi:hypothetical protein